jgi:uncharacterized pyridoxamine 5'-phosphate oxidase family protein
MDFKQEYVRIMGSARDVALASAMGDTPNVRIVIFCTDTQRDGVAYIATFNRSQKVAEFEQNDKVSFVTAPVGADAVRVSRAVIKKSDRTMEELKSGFIAKFPPFQNIIDQAGPMMVVYEIHFSEADVIVGFNNTQHITL